MVYLNISAKKRSSVLWEKVVAVFESALDHRDSTPAPSGFSFTKLLEEPSNAGRKNPPERRCTRP
jgi:hypothetical protein